MFLHGAGQFDARRPAADNGKRVLPTGSECCVVVTLNLFPALQEGSKGLDADGVAFGAWNGAAVGARTQIQREDVEMDSRPLCAAQCAAHQVDFFDTGLNQPGTCHLRQRAQINQEIVFLRVSADESGQRTGVGSVDIAGDERDIKTRHRVFRQTHEHGQMAVPAPEQDQALLEGDGLSVVHASVTCVCRNRVPGVTLRWSGCPIRCTGRLVA